MDLVSIEVSGFKELDRFKLDFNNLSFVAGLDGGTKDYITGAINFVFDFIYSVIDERSSLIYMTTSFLKAKVNNNFSFTLTFKDNDTIFKYHCSFKPVNKYCNYPKVQKESLILEESNQKEKTIFSRKGNACVYYNNNSEYTYDLDNDDLAIDIYHYDEGFEFDLAYVETIKNIFNIKCSFGHFYQDYENYDLTSKLYSIRKHHKEYYELFSEKVKELTGLNKFDAHKRKDKHNHVNYKVLEIEKDNYLKDLSIFDLTTEDFKIINVLYDIIVSNINNVNILIISDLDRNISPKKYYKLLNAINELNVTTKIIISTSNFEMMKYFNLLLTTFVLVDKNEVVRTKQISKSKLNLFFEDIRNYNLNTKSYLEEILLSDDPLNEFDRYI